MVQEAPQIPTETAADALPATGPSARDRICDVCQVKLSSYNPGPNCWQHTIGYPWRGPTAKPKY